MGGSFRTYATALYETVIRRESSCAPIRMFGSFRTYATALYETVIRREASALLHGHLVGKISYCDGEQSAMVKL